MDHDAARLDRSALLGAASILLEMLQHTDAADHWRDMARDWLAGYKRVNAGQRANVEWLTTTQPETRD
jgi:hypothetical protein